MGVHAVESEGPVAGALDHGHGCRRWFSLVRDTATDAIVSDPEPIGWPPPRDTTWVDPTADAAAADAADAAPEAAAGAPGSPAGAS